jgi:hypothetical protein
LQGFGRVTLPNVLPYPGIETVLTLHVVETEIFAYQQISHLVQVNDISRPMKATIVWMDPNNAIMTNKMLLNNLDLKVITPTGLILYGNNISGDEVNNVSRLASPLPSSSLITESTLLPSLLPGRTSDDHESCARRVFGDRIVLLPRNNFSKFLIDCHWW